MDISLNDDQTLLRETARAFAREALTPDRIRALEETEQGFDPAVWRRMVDMGWAAAPFPEDYGGAAAGMTELALIVEALGEGAVPSPLFSTVIESGLLLLDAGSPEQCRRWIPRIAAGETILATALFEPAGGLAPEQIRTRAAPDGNGWKISGRKLFVRDAGAAEGVICIARTGEGPTDLALFLVPRDAAGLSLTRLPAAGGEALWEVAFDGVAVDGDARIGAPGMAWDPVARLLLRGAVFKSAELVGIGQASLDLTLAYARERVQFGKPIGSFQAVQHHCADMYRDLEISRLLTWSASAALCGPGEARAAAIAKAKCSEVIPALTRTAHQIHGAVAFYRSYPLELYFHRALAAKSTYGDSRDHRRALAKMLRDDPEGFRGENRHDLQAHTG